MAKIKGFSCEETGENIEFEESTLITIISSEGQPPQHHVRFTCPLHEVVVKEVAELVGDNTETQAKMLIAGGAQPNVYRGSEPLLDDEVVEEFVSEMNNDTDFSGQYQRLWDEIEDTYKIASLGKGNLLAKA